MAEQLFDSFRVFSILWQPTVVHWNLSDSKSIYKYGNLSILVNLNNSLVLMVSILPQNNQ